MCVLKIYRKSQGVKQDLLIMQHEEQNTPPQEQQVYYVCVSEFCVFVCEGVRESVCDTVSGGCLSVSVCSAYVYVWYV